MSGKTSNNNNDNISSSKNYKLRRIKEFVPQESLLRQLFVTCRGFQTLFACLMALIHAFIVIQGIAYYYDRKSYKEDASFLHWSFVETFPSFFTSWCQLFILTSMFYPITMMWKAGFLPYPLLLTLFAGYITVTTMIVKSSQLSPALMGALASEHTRMMMKVTAFLVAQIRKSKTESSSVDGDNGQHKQETSFTHYQYFLFAPTLVFRENYPRKDHVNWKRVFALFYYFLICVFMTFVSVRHWITPMFEDVGLKPIDHLQWLHYQKFAYVSAFVFHIAGIGFALIHCWMNIWAEVMRFADRNFYQDWWNADSPQEQLRSWNSVIGDWIYEYVYAGIVHVSSGNKVLSTMAVFFMSSIIHDYVVNMMLDMRFLPVMTITYGLLSSMLMTTLLSLQKTGITRYFQSHFLSNGIIHLLTGAAWLIWVNVYPMEYYCRKNAPLIESSLIHAFRPQFYSCVRFR